MPGSFNEPAVCTDMTQPVASSVAVPLVKDQTPFEASTHVEEGTTLALVGPVDVKGRAQPTSPWESKWVNSTPPSISTTVSTSEGLAPPPPALPNISEKLMRPPQLPTSVAAPASMLHATVLLPPELLALPLLELPLELELELPLQAQPQLQPRAPQVSALKQGALHAGQVSGPQDELLELLPLLLLSL